MTKIWNEGAKKCTDEELQEVIDEAYEQWDKDNTVFSLSDFEEAVRELTIRENN